MGVSAHLSDPTSVGRAWNSPGDTVIYRAILLFYSCLLDSPNWRFFRIPPEGKWREDARWHENMENTRFYQQTSFGCSISILSKEVLFRLLRQSSSGRSHVGSLFSSQKQKKNSSWGIWWVQNSSTQGSVFATFKRRLLTNGTKNPTKNCCVCNMLYHSYLKGPWCCDDDDDVELNVLGCRVDILGTNCDQCVCMVQCCFTSTETIRLIRTGSTGRPSRLSHSSWTLPWCFFFRVSFKHKVACVLSIEPDLLVVWWTKFRTGFLQPRSHMND